MSQGNGLPLIRDARRDSRTSREIPGLTVTMRYFSLLISTAAILLYVAGCRGYATVRMVPFMRSDLAPASPLVRTVRPTEAYYWLDDEGKLNISLGYRSKSIFGEAFDAEWLMSVVLDGLPAGSQKLYQLRKQAVRITSSHGGIHTRSRSGRGVALVHARQGGHLKGRFHITVHQQGFSVLNGWSPRGLLVVVGDFFAVEDKARGADVLARTEQDGFGRDLDTGPTIRWLGTRPATRPTSGPGP